MNEAPGIGSPLLFEERFAERDFARLARLAFRWSHTEHFIGNSLKVLMRLTDEEAVVAVFPLPMDRRVNLIRKFVAISPVNQDAQRALDEFCFAWTKIQHVRNTVVHAVFDDSSGEPSFHLRGKGRTWTVKDIFAAEELTNYAAHAAISLRYALGLKGANPNQRHPLPPRPAVPEFLRNA